MTRARTEMEGERLDLQGELDARKSQSERNKLGQFATPTQLARDILRHAKGLLDSDAGVHFLDPAIGTGSFFSALQAEFSPEEIKSAIGYEIDQHYGLPAASLWAATPLDYRLGDFTTATPDQLANLLICNPPYVRHHHIGADKARLQTAAMKAIGAKLGGLSGLYCYFLALAHRWMAPGGIAGWLIPSEFMNVNYGKAIKQYLLEEVTLLQVHRFDPNDVQFADALVSSAIVWFRNERPRPEHEVKFTFGGKLGSPSLERLVPTSVLAREPKWTRFPLADLASVERKGPTVSDFFKIKRGIATGDNGFFVLDENVILERDLPFEAFRPILPSPRYVKCDEIFADGRGIPTNVQRLFLLDPRLPEEEIDRQYPGLAQYLEEGRGRDLHQRYLCRHRSPWYAQEKREPPPIVCTYLGRGDAKSGRPFRFIRNRSRATIANVYLAMYPSEEFQRLIDVDPDLLDLAWSELNEVSPEALLGEARVYGGGLHKLEPRELATVPLNGLADAIMRRGVQPWFNGAGDLLEAAE